jgi:hypothetical protein
MSLILKKFIRASRTGLRPKFQVQGRAGLVDYCGFNLKVESSHPLIPFWNPWPRMRVSRFRRSDILEHIPSLLHDAILHPFDPQHPNLELRSRQPSGHFDSRLSMIESLEITRGSSCNCRSMGLDGRVNDQKSLLGLPVKAGAALVAEVAVCTYHDITCGAGTCREVEDLGFKNTGPD